MVDLLLERGMVVRVIDNMVGGREAYEARCRHCHVVPRKDEGQGALL